MIPDHGKYLFAYRTSLAASNGFMLSKVRS